jgi:hypothetical protein
VDIGSEKCNMPQFVTKDCGTFRTLKVPPSITRNLLKAAGGGSEIALGVDDLSETHFSRSQIEMHG